MLNYKLIYNILFSLLLLGFIACNRNTKKTDSEEKTIASAGNEELKESEYKTSLIYLFSKKDSAQFAKKTIENWATESLFYQEALSKLEEQEIDIESQVNVYRKQLVNYIYESKLIENNLDTIVSKKEIEDYYNQHIENFILKDNIIKVNYFKVPVQYKEVNKLKKLFYSTVEKDKQQLYTLCMQYAENFFLNDSTWLFLDEIKREIPKLNEQLDYNLVPGRVIEFSDNDAYYFLKIKDVKVKNSISPLTFEKNNIKIFIINSRKVELIKSYKKQLLEKAKAEKAFKIF